MDCNYFKKKRDEILLCKKFTSNYSLTKHKQTCPLHRKTRETNKRTSR